MFIKQWVVLNDLLIKNGISQTMMFDSSLRDYGLRLYSVLISRTACCNAKKLYLKRSFVSYLKYIPSQKCHEYTEVGLTHKQKHIIPTTQEIISLRKSIQSSDL